MKTLLDLAKELGLRAEALREHLAERGVHLNGIDATLDADTEDFVRECAREGRPWTDRILPKTGRRDDRIAELFAETVGVDPELMKTATSPPGGLTDPLDHIPRPPQEDKRARDTDAVGAPAMFEAADTGSGVDADSSAFADADALDGSGALDGADDFAGADDGDLNLESFLATPEPVPSAARPPQPTPESRAPREMRTEAQPGEPAPVADRPVTPGDDELDLSALAMAADDPAEPLDAPTETALADEAVAMADAADSGETGAEAFAFATEVPGEDSDTMTLEDLEGLSLSELAGIQDGEDVSVPVLSAAGADSEEVDLEAMLSSTSSRLNETVPDEDDGDALDGDLDIESFLGVSLEREDPPDAAGAKKEGPQITALLRDLAARLRPRSALHILLPVLGALVIAAGLTAALQLRRGPDYPDDPREVLAEANALLTRENPLWEPARERFEHLLQEHPDHAVRPNALFGLARVAFHQGDYERAQSLFTEARKAFEAARLAAGGPMKDLESREEREADYWIARSLMGRGIAQYDKAKSQFLAVVRNYRNSESQRDSYILLGDLCYEGARAVGNASEYHEAKHYYNEYITAIDNPATHPGAYRLATVYDKLGRVYEALAEHDTDPERKEAHWRDAIRHYAGCLGWVADESVPVEPAYEQPVLVVLALGRTYKNLGDFFADLGGREEPARDAYGRARDYYQAALDRYLRNDRFSEAAKRANVDLAWSLLGLGDWRGAITQSETILELYADAKDRSVQATAYYIQGDAYGEHNMDLACDAYKQALILSPKAGPNNRHSQRAHMRLVNYMYFAREQWEAAAAGYDNIIRNYPKGGEGPYTMTAFYNLAVCKQKLGLYAEAIRYFNRLDEDYEQFRPFVDPVLSENARFQVAHCHYLSNEFGRAIDAYDRAFASVRRWSPPEGFVMPRGDKYRDAAIELARACRIAQKYDKAADTYRGLLADYPEADADGRLSLEYADTLARSFNWAAARDVYHSVAKRFPDLPAGLTALTSMAECYTEEAQALGPNDSKFDGLMSHAIRIHEALHRTNPGDPTHLGRACVLLREAGRIRESNRLLERLFDRVEESGIAGVDLDLYRYTYALNARDLGERGEAVKSFDRMQGISTDPQDRRRHAHALDEAGRFYYAEKDMETARDRFETIVSHYGHLAGADAEIGRWVQDARDYLNRIEANLKIDGAVASS